MSESPSPRQSPVTIKIPPKTIYLDDENYKEEPKFAMKPNEELIIQNIEKKSSRSPSPTKSPKRSKSPPLPRERSVSPKPKGSLPTILSEKCIKETGIISQIYSKTRDEFIPIECQYQIDIKNNQDTRELYLLDTVNVKFSKYKTYLGMYYMY